MAEAAPTFSVGTGAGDEFVGRFLETAVNPPELAAEHQRKTGGKPYFRFPPEPNGYLHIGHAKSMNLNFGSAKKKGGFCYLRYDDTNPEAESQEYIDAIEENVRWLGWKPDKITFSSDYFDQLYDFAVSLIKKGLAYVDHSTSAELKQQRDNREASPYRDTPVDVNLRKFNDMKLGLYDEGEVILRLKMDYMHDNPNMRDVIAYRIKYHPHPHAKDKWCIYPTYDYTHCIIDSLEDITHSLCTLEFEIRRDSYYWLLWALDLYRPNVWEFSRLNIAGSVMSKRKINWLVRNGKVRGWDDPRLFTLAGLRRRGYTPEAINAFCDAVGVTRTHNVIDPKMLEHFQLADLDARAPRRFAVLRPLRVTLINLGEGERRTVEMPNHPKDATMGSRTVVLTRVVFIEQTDFREEDDKKYYGLAPGKEVQLKYGPNIRAVALTKDPSTGAVIGVDAEVDWEKRSKVKGCLHWVSEPEPGVAPTRAEVRLYDNLFTCESAATSDDFASFLNPESELVLQALVEPHLKGAQPLAKFQFERLGYFSVDPTTTPEQLVINRTLPLRSDFVPKC
eukprot:RCo049685